MKTELLHKYFRGETTEKEENQIVEWVESSVENKEHFLKERMLFDVTLFSDGSNIQRKPKGHLYLYPLIAIAAMLAIVFVMDLPHMHKPKQQLSQTIRIPAGQRAQMDLPDGSIVWLNSQTTLTYDENFGKKDRKVTLDGEAYFEVEHDRRAPFVVSTNGLDIEVLGTRFNIRNDDNEHRVTTVLLEGAVKAYASGREQASVRLHPAQQLVFDTRTHAMRLTDCPSAERSINWIDGRFCFEHDTFGEIVAELKRYYNVDIRFMDNRLRDMRFSGNFRVEDGIYHIMSVLQLTYKFNYRIAGNDIELYANPER